MKTLKSQIVTSKVELPCERVERRILSIRGQKVMLDADLAELYEVETKALNRAVRRNASRFPADFMFQLTPQESQDLRRQFGTSNPGGGGRRYQPLAFTEQGVATLSRVLRDPRAVQVNIAIMRAPRCCLSQAPPDPGHARRSIPPPRRDGKPLRPAVPRRLRRHR
jgi:hypothetical protein